jgi:hypothetical protein
MEGLVVPRSASQEPQDRVFWPGWADDRIGALKLA